MSRHPYNKRRYTRVMVQTVPEVVLSQISEEGARHLYRFNDRLVTTLAIDWDDNSAPFAMDMN